MPNSLTTIEADLTLVGGEFRSGVQVTFSGSDSDTIGGRIQQVTQASQPPGNTPALRLARRALLPGFVNVHSHAFQRALRGLGESYPAGMGDFWSWREAMYNLVLRLGPEEFVQVCKQAFAEMLACGITTVGEFHYLHHSVVGAKDDAREGPEDFQFDELVMQAARAAGIRLVLLESFYKTGGFGQPLAGGQRRFATPSVGAFLRHVDALGAKLDPRTQSLGLAPHSLRAVPSDDLRRLFAAAVERGLPCHIHVEEQRKEIEDCRALLGMSPLEWLVANVSLGPNVTIVHATHSTTENLRRYLATGANVCVCPITEGNLGDGLGDVATMMARLDAVCIGSDSNVRIDMGEELRWLEFVRRLRHEKRGICKTPDGDVPRQLLECGTVNGARALGLTGVGPIDAGCAADFFTIDLDHPSLAGATPESLLGAFLLGSSGAAVREVCVAGRWVRGDPVGAMRGC